MAGIGGSGNSNSSYDSSINYTTPFLLMISLFLVFGAVTVLNDILIPHLKEIFDLSNAQAMTVQSCFFGAYFVMGAPGGWLLNKLGYTKGIALGLIILAIGMLLFIPGPQIFSFYYYLVDLFIMGSGLAILQAAANPYSAACGRPEKTGMRMNIVGSVNSAATTFMPLVGGALVYVQGTKAEKLAAMTTPYLGLATVVIVLALLIYILKLPHIVKSEEDAGTTEEVESPWKYKHLVMGALAIFFYVGAEVACGSILTDYLATPEMGGYSKEDAKYYVSLYWGGLMVGRFAGIFILQFVKIKRALMVAAILALLFTVVTMVTKGSLSKWSLCCIGLCCSIMWPSIFPLGIAGLGKATGKGSGIIVSMIVGGAVIPPLQGYLADELGYKLSFIIVIISFVYILYYALKGHVVTHPKALENIEQNKSA